jgi:hypothetical protein
VHVREDGRNGADLAGRFSSPGGSVQMFDKNLVYAIIGPKDLDRGSAELSVSLVLTRGHGALISGFQFDFRCVALDLNRRAKWL